MYWVYDIDYDVYAIYYMNSRYMGQIGILRSMKVASTPSRYSTMEIGTLPGPTWESLGLGNSKRHISVSTTTKDVVPVGVLEQFELVELAVLEPFVRQQLPQFHLHLEFKDSDILLTIAFLTYVKDIHLPILDRPDQPLMHVVINLSSVAYACCDQPQQR